MDTSDLSPNQRRIVTDLLAADDLVRPRFTPELAVELRVRLERELATAVARLDLGESRSFNKFAVYQVHACEGLAAARSTFSWTIPAVRGQLAHKAIELTFASPGIAPPFDLIDRAVEILARSEDPWGPGEFLRSLDPMDVAQLKADANDAVVKFSMDWPPIDRRWFPRVESPCSVSLCDGRIRLRAKYDLAFGRPSGTEARVIIIDFKTGGQYQRYSDDLRFYALVDTLRNGIPPFRIAGYYLDSGTFTVENVTEDTLAAAARRTVDAVRKIVDVSSGARPPSLTPGGWCRFCPERLDCEPGRAYLAGAGAPAESLD